MRQIKGERMTYLATLPTELFDAIGVAGFGLYVLNYTLLTVHKVSSHQIRYFILNLFAASMVLIGLISAFNLASALIQGFWIVISIVAITIRIRNPETEDDSIAPLPGATLRRHANVASIESRIAPPFALQRQRDPRWLDASRETNSPDRVSGKRNLPHAAG
jgi:hypothetical protein